MHSEKNDDVFRQSKSGNLFTVNIVRKYIKKKRRHTSQRTPSTDIVLHGRGLRLQKDKFIIN